MILKFMLPFFIWCDHTAVGEYMRSGTWQFPLVETIHILALAILIGSATVLNLRLMGVLMRGWTVAALMREIRPYLNWSLAIILVSGVLLYLSEAAKTFDNLAFWAKVYLIIGATAFHYIVVRRMARADEIDPTAGRIVGFVSLLLWLGIGWAGRAIAFI
jgi:hypothetical protein